MDPAATPDLTLPAILLGLLGLLVALGGAALARLLRPAPRPPEGRPSPFEAASAAREATEKAEADKSHAEKAAEFAKIKAIPDKDARQAAEAAWLRKHRRGAWDPPMWLVGILVVFGLALMLSLVAGCAPKVPPEVYAVPLPALPESLLVEPDPPQLAEDGCDALELVPGSPLPPELLGVALRGVPTAACRGIVADGAELVAYGQCEADRERLQQYLSAEREARTSDRLVCEAAYGQEWTYAQDLRRDGRALRWAGLGGVTVALVVGFGLGLGAGLVSP